MKRKDEVSLNKAAAKTGETKSRIKALAVAREISCLSVGEKHGAAWRFHLPTLIAELAAIKERRLDELAARKAGG